MMEAVRIDVNRSGKLKRSVKEEVKHTRGTAAAHKSGILESAAYPFDLDSPAGSFAGDCGVPDVLQLVRVE